MRPLSIFESYFPHDDLHALLRMPLGLRGPSSYGVGGRLRLWLRRARHALPNESDDLEPPKMSPGFGEDDGG